MRPRNGWILFLIVGLGVAGLDLWTKSLAFDALGVRVDTSGERPRLVALDGAVDPLTGLPPKEDIVVIPGCFDLEATINFGAFSGWFGGHTEWLALLSFAAIFIIAGVLFLSLRRPPPAPTLWFVLALALLWGGTIGNFYDRWLIGAVRDFVKWYVVIGGKERVWPNFNIADSGICVGVGLFLLNELVLRHRAARSEGPANAASPDAARGS